MTTTVSFLSIIHRIVDYIMQLFRLRVCSPLNQHMYKDDSNESHSGVIMMQVSFASAKKKMNNVKLC
jgi:hypothetical protein